MTAAFSDDAFWGALCVELDRLTAPPAYRWECDLAECNGTPHDGWNYSHARTKQRRPDGDWFIWLLLLGRGWGKTRTGAEAFLDIVLDNPRTEDGKSTNWLIAGPTFAETRDVCVEGPSGLIDALELRGLEENTHYRYDKSKWRITLNTGQRIYLRGGDSPKLGVGTNLAGAWVDEYGLWKTAKTAWSQALSKAIRQKLPGGKNRVMVTTTPRVKYAEALKQLKEWINRTDGSVHVTRGSTFENEHNLSKEYLEEILRDSPPGTRIYREEVMGEVLDDVVGALWEWAHIDDHRVDAIPDGEEVVGRVLTIDPATTSGPDSDETGMHLVAKTMRDRYDDAGKKLPRSKEDAHFYIEQDLTMRVPAAEWSQVAVKTAVEHGAVIVYECDQGGDAWAEILRTAARTLGLPCPQIKSVRAATEGSKATRAQPVVARYVEGRVHHVGRLPKTEDQMTTWVPGQTKKSPDRVDSLVYGVLHLDNRLRRPARAAY